MRYSRHPVFVFFGTTVVMFVFGQLILTPIALGLIDANIVKHFDVEGRVALRALALVAAINAVLFIPVWLIICIANRRLVWALNGKQRKWAGGTILIIPAILLLLEIPRLPQRILFDGPIRGYHPLAPTFIFFFSILVAICFWLWIAKIERRNAPVISESG